MFPEIRVGVRSIRALYALVLVCAPAGALAAGLNTVLVGTYSDDGGSMNAVAVRGNYAFLLADGGFKVIDISNPSNPQRVGKEIFGGGSGLAVSGNYAYVTGYDNRLHVIDVTDRSSPRLAGSCDLTFQVDLVRGPQVAVTDTIAVVTYYNRLDIIDVSIPSRPQRTGSWDSPGAMTGVALVGTYAYVVGADVGNVGCLLQVIDLHTGSNPELVGSWHDTNNWTWAMAVAGSQVYIDCVDTLRVINIANPANPKAVGESEIPYGDRWGLSTSMAVSDTYAFVPVGSSGLSIFDISNPANPQPAGSYDTGGTAYAVAVEGNRAYLLDYNSDSKLSIIEMLQPATRYVNVSNSSPALPYTNWATAATTIQDAIDVAVSGDEIVVTNGVYQTGGCAAFWILSPINRVCVTKPLTIRSVNGPGVTVIRGYQLPEFTNGDSAVRCVYLTDGATLSGFTLTGGATGNCSGCNDYTDYGGAAFCSSPSAVLSNCVLSANSAYEQGGGAYGGTLIDCTLSGNSAFSGGGASGATLNNCALTANSAYAGGGGATYSALNNCTLTGNSARDSGGGALGSTLNNCIVYFNSTALGVESNCSYSTLNYSCTTPLPPDGVGNIEAEPQLASGSHLSAASPCRRAGSAAYSSGVDIDGEAWANSPSIGCDEYREGALAGELTVAVAASFPNVAVGFVVDFQAQIDGRLSASRWEFDDGTVVSNRPYTSHKWAAVGDYPVVLRAYNESYPQGVSATGIVHVVQLLRYVALDNSSPLAPYDSWATAATNIQDAIDAAAPGGLVLVSNGVYETGGRVGAGVSNRVVVTKKVTVQSVNGPDVTVIRGNQMPGDFVRPDLSVRCAFLTDGTALAGFTLTNGGAKFGSGGGVWCESANAVVSNCILSRNAAETGGGAFSGTLNNCTLRANSAFDLGGGAVRSTLNNCLLTGNSATPGTNVSLFDVGGGGGAYGATLNNCTLTGNSAYARGGGGAFCCLSNCTLTGNYALIGGGAYGASLNNCTLTGNSAGTLGGGGAYCASLNNCTLTRNSAGTQGGGALLCPLNNCIVYDNTAHVGRNYADGAGSVLNYCCTTPMPGGGVGNITKAPLFVDPTSGNFRLQSNSPCINAGRNSAMLTAADLDGNPRIVGGSVDIGAYEFQTPQSTLSYAWLQQYGLATDGSADFADPDGDGHNNWQEWRAQTDPTNPVSALRLLMPTTSGNGPRVRWQSVLGQTYFLERSTNLFATVNFVRCASNIVGQAGVAVYTDTNAVGAGPFFYRVGVQE